MRTNYQYTLFTMQASAQTYHGVPSPNVLCWFAILAKFVMRYRPAMIMNMAQQINVVSGQRYACRTITRWKEVETSERAIVVGVRWCCAVLSMWSDVLATIRCAVQAC